MLKKINIEFFLFFIRQYENSWSFNILEGGGISLKGKNGETIMFKHFLSKVFCKFLKSEYISSNIKPEEKKT